MQELNILRNQIANSDAIVAFTGAGISTGSGLPDYRGPNGLWTLSKSNEEASKFLLASLPALVASCSPNRGHLALTKLWDAGKLLGVVTQNVDRLHQTAGIPEFAVHELHGSGDDVVHFGDPLPRRTWMKAEKAINDCDTLLVIGSSLTVYPAAGLVGAAQDSGKFTAIINAQATDYDRDADVVIRGDCSDVLQQICLTAPRT